MKQTLLAILLCIICAGCAKNAPAEKIVIKINDYSLTIGEFNELFSKIKASEDTPKARADFLENLINLLRENLLLY